MKSVTDSGVGLGIRRPQLNELIEHLDHVDFVEAAPENWIGVGGSYARKMRQITERKPFVCHGLSLSLGGPDALDLNFVRDVRDFLTLHGAVLYSEHLSACTDNAHLYDLMPLPFTEAIANHIAERVLQVQELIGRRMAVENSSYYLPLKSELSELDFLLTIQRKADCDLLLDVNNVFVNSVNHRYDARTFIAALPSARISYLHVAGHEREAPDLIVDTHGAPVVQEVFELLDFTYQVHGKKPTLLERDFELPPMSELIAELAQIKRLPGRTPAELQRVA
jgi:hypothetical protein